MASEQDLKDAAEALASPDAPAEVKAAARRLLSALPPKEAKPSDFGEHSSLGPTGLEAMQQGGLPKPDQADEQRQEVEKAFTQSPEVAKALQLGAAPAQAPLVGESPEEGARRHQVYIAENYDQKLQTASKRKDLAAPPEFVPPTPVQQQPLNFFDALHQTREMLPEHFGGKVQHYYEPGIDQFRRDMAPALGPKVLQMTEGSEEYKQYADKLWKTIYEHAQATGQPVVRESFRTNKAPEDKLLHGVEMGIGSLGSAAIGADKGMTGGIGGKLLTEKDNRDALTSAFPISSDVGFAAGAGNPNSVGSLAAKGAGKAVGAIPGAAALAGTTAGRIAGSAGQGAVGAAATQGAMDLVGGESAGASGRAGSAALIGSLLGLGGGVVGELASSEGQSLRKESPLGEAEKIGARTSVRNGINPGKEMQALRSEAQAEQIGPAHAPDVESMLAGKLEGPLTDEGRRLRGTEEARVGTALETFHKVNQKERVAPERTVQAYADLHAKLTDAQGNPLPKNRPQVNSIRHDLRDMVDLEAVPVKSSSPEQVDFDRRFEARNEELYARKRDVPDLADPFASAPASEPSRTAPGGKIQGEKTLPDEITPVALGDLEMPKGTSIPPPAERPDLWKGNGIGRLKEIHKTNDAAYKITGAEARKQGFDVDEAVAKALGITADDVRNEAAQGNDLSKKVWVIVKPKQFSPGEFHEIVAGVNQANKAGQGAPPDVRLTKGTSRAIREDRDRFGGATADIPADLKYTIKDEQGRPINLKGYSAYHARSSDELAALKRKLDLAGVGENPPELLPGSPYRGFVGNARAYGSSGRAPEIDQSLRELASSAGEHGHPGTVENLDKIKYARAVAELEHAAKVTQMFRGFGGNINPTERMSALGLRLRLDPALQYLAPRAANVGAAGALPGYRDQRKALPPQADQATIDQISRLLGAGP